MLTAANGYVTSTMGQHASLFTHPGLKSVGGASPPRTTITNLLVECYACIVAAIQARTVVEIGAHEASFSCDIKARLPDATVIALEANPHVFEHYCNARHIKAADISYEMCAISDTDGTVEFNIPTLVAGATKPLTNMMGSLGRLSLPNSAHETISVKAETLDTFLSSYPNDPLAIWIDVEGMVDRVLAGGTASVQRASVVICEVETAQVWGGQATAANIMERFSEHGFVPIARDCQKAFQFNVLLVKPNLLANPDVEAAVRSYTGKTESLLSALGTA